MKYMGSKNRIAGKILPIMLKEAESRGLTTWVEPFVGGANMIDKVPPHFKRMGGDLNPHTIQALIAIRDLLCSLPSEVSEEYYNSIKGLPPDPISSWIRCAVAYAGKFGNVMARGSGRNVMARGSGRNVMARGSGRNYATEAVRNAQKQSPKIQGVEFIYANYYDFSHLSNTVIYCDPPYEGTSSYITGAFDHSKFWAWCREMGEKNLVFVSEYNAPSDFYRVWEGTVKTNFASNRKKATHEAAEKLFMYVPKSERI